MQWIQKHGGVATSESYGKYLAQVKSVLKESFWEMIGLPQPPSSYEPDFTEVYDN